MADNYLENKYAEYQARKTSGTRTGHTTKTCLLYTSQTSDYLKDTAIKHLRSIGFDVNNDLFADNSWYFRNALVRANYRNVRKDVEPDMSFLIAFFRNLMMGENHDPTTANRTSRPNKYRKMCIRDRFTDRQISVERLIH